MWKRLLHWISHVTKTNTGKVISYNEDGFICVGFECSCGLVDPKTISKINEKELLNGKYRSAGIGSDVG